MLLFLLKRIKIIIEILFFCIRLLTFSRINNFCKIYYINPSRQGGHLWTFYQLWNYKKKKKHGLLINKDLSQYKLWARKHLELQVKLSSLAEETKCYKYWIDDGLNLNKETVFIKYADFLTHVINLGIDKHYIENYEVLLRPNDYCLSDQFLNLYIDINDLIISPSTDHFFTLLEDSLSLGVTLGYSEEEIFNSFIY